MARLSPHTDNRPNNVIGIHNDKSQRDLSKDDSSSKVTYPSAATRFFKKGKLVPQQKSTTTPSLTKETAKAGETIVSFLQRPASVL